MRHFRFSIFDFRLGARRPALCAPADRRSQIANRASAGFTLLEVMLSVALVLALAGSVYAFYFLTLDARETLQRESETLFAQRRVLDLMAEDVRSAQSVPLLFGLKGQADEFEFMRARVPSPAVFYEQSFTRGEAADELAGGAFELQADYEYVKYHLEPPDPDDEEDEIGPLIRTSVKTLTSDGIRAGVNAETVALSDHVKFLYLEYRSGDEWVEQWTDSGVPPAVRITLGLEPLPEETEPVDYPYATVWREVAIPATGGSGSSGGRSDGAGRGGGDGAGRGNEGAGP